MGDRSQKSLTGQDIVLGAENRNKRELTRSQESCAAAPTRNVARRYPKRCSYTHPTMNGLTDRGENPVDLPPLKVHPSKKPM